MYKILYNRLMLIMLLVVVLVLAAPLFAYPLLSAPDTMSNLFGALLIIAVAVNVWVAFSWVIPKFCIKRCAKDGVL